MKVLDNISKLLNFILELLILMICFELLGHIPIIQEWCQSLLNLLEQYSVWTDIIIGLFACLVTVFMLPLTPVIVLIVLSNRFSVFSWQMVQLCIIMSLAITVGRIILYELSVWYHALLTKQHKVNVDVVEKWVGYLNKPGGRIFYLLSGCIPGFPDAYFSVACGMMKYDLWFYTWAGFISKIVKVYLYILLIKFLDYSTSMSVHQGWGTIVVQLTIICLIYISLYFIKVYHKRKTFKKYAISKGKLNGQAWVKLNLPKDKYEIAFVSSKGQSPFEYQLQHPEVQISCNGGLFKIKTKEPLGQTIIAGQIINSEKVTDDNGKVISDKECYPLILDQKLNLSEDKLNRSCEDLVQDSEVLSSLCGWGSLIIDYKGQLLYKKEIVHQYPICRQRLILCQDEEDNYILYAFHKAHYKEVEEFLLKENIKFAYCLDGGHSTQIYINNYRLTKKYYLKKGRQVNTIITFKKK